MVHQKPAIIMKLVSLGIALLTAFFSNAQTLAVHFDFDKYDLDNTARRMIDSFLVAERDRLSTGKLELSGHCDPIGSDSYNDSLSLRRVMTVKNFLEKNYVEPGKIAAARPYGERKPLNENKTEEDRRLNRRVEITIIAPELPVQKEAPVQKKDDASLIKKLGDSTVKAGSSIVLRNINFVGGRHQFLPEAYPVLQELLETMKKYPRLVIAIHGHICCEQTDADALDADTRTYTLSEERAKAVYSYLVTNGIESSRLTYKGFGHSAPIYPYPEQSEEERIQNRRVELKIISK
jgi:outer membrane protein OmpA-like peptidoglycan-associated protein